MYNLSEKLIESKILTYCVLIVYCVCIDTKKVKSAQLNDWRNVSVRIDCLKKVYDTEVFGYKRINKNPAGLKNFLCKYLPLFITAERFLKWHNVLHVRLNTRVYQL